MRNSAVISDCSQYRYVLRRQWRDAFTGVRTVGFVMLNPSTADGTIDDPTIRRLIGFAKLWGMDALEVVNLYALRSTDPKGLWQHADPVGPKNDDYIDGWARRSRACVAAWGANAKPDRVAEVLALMNGRPLYCLGTTKSGAPRHPLYVKGNTGLIPWPTSS